MHIYCMNYNCVIIVMQNSNKVRAMSLFNGGEHNFDAKNFEEMCNLHFLILDGCNVDGNLGSISKELRYLQWRHMPQTHIPSMLNFSNLVSLDFSESTKLANTWVEAEPGLEVTKLHHNLVIRIGIL